MATASKTSTSAISGGDRLKILFVVPSLTRAGAEKQLVDLVNELSSDKFEKHLLCYETDRSLSEIVDRDSVVLHFENKTRKFDYRLVRRIADVIDSHAIDVVHCSLQNALLFGGLACRLSSRSVRLFGVIHTTINVDLKHELADRLLYQFLLRRCTEVWFVCHSQAQHWINKFAFLESKSCVIYNGVDSRSFVPDGTSKQADQLRPKYAIPTDAVVLSCVAGFRPEKGHDILLRAFKKVVNSCPHAYLALVGDGPTRTEVEQLADELGIRDQVLFLGRLDDVRPVLSISCCTILASTAVETFSIAMLESMSMGVPVVATDIGGAS
jgi:glycosyltransferase involved in cell wall biosynthesis